MKKLLAFTITAALAFSSTTVAFADEIAVKKGADVVAAATGSTPAPAPAPKPAPKPSTKPAPAKPAPAKPAEPAKNNKYNDGIYVTYGNAYSKGTEGAKVTIKDDKIVDIELMRTSPKLIDRDPRYNYKELWNAYEVMKARFIGKTREEAQKVDIVAGATRSSEGWKLSVDRAFERAAKVKQQNIRFFEGEHMGVDPLGKYMVFAKFDKTKLIGVKVYPMNEKGDAIDEKAMTPEQKKTVQALANELINKGLSLKTVKGYESEVASLMNAYWDAVQNAKIFNNSKYIDGFYSAYGSARDKGVERADIYIRNGKLVDVKLYRLGSNLIDRGATAYAEVVKANAPMVKKFLEKGFYFENYNDKVDGIAGATESSHSWNIAVERAFQKALAKPLSSKYFEGTFAGVDNQSKVLVLVDIKSDKITKVSSYLFGSDQKLIKEEALTAEQKSLLASINAGLLKDGVKMAAVHGHEEHSKAAVAAFEDALTNASTKMGKYKDGTFVGYGGAYDKGTQRATVTLRNGKIVAIKLERTGLNLVDRGATAYAEVVKAIPILTENYMKASTKENALKVDVVSGATGSSNGFKQAVEGAFNKAEIVKSQKVAYMNGVYAGVDSSNSIYVLITIENNLPAKMQMFFLDANAKAIAEDKLTAEQKAAREEILSPQNDQMYKYVSRAVPIGTNEYVKEISAKTIEAIKVALEAAGR